MNRTQEFVDLFVNETGELFYFIAIFVIYVGAGLMALDQRMRSRQEQAAGRYVVGLVLALAAWLALMGAAVLGLVMDDSAPDILPPLERAVNSAILIFIGWSLLTAEYGKKDKTAWMVATVMLGIIGATLGITYRDWDPALDFNAHSYSYSWTMMPVVLGIFGIILLFTRYRHVADIPLKFLFFLILILGHSYAVYQQFSSDLEGDASGAVRWSFLVSSLLVIVLVYRVVIDRMRAVVTEVATYAESVSKPQQAIKVAAVTVAEGEFSSEPILSRQTSSAGAAAVGGRNESMELLRALGVMLDSEESHTLPDQIARAIAQTLRGDVAVVGVYEDAHWIDIVAAFDAAKSQPIQGHSTVSLRNQPTLVNTLETNHQNVLGMHHSGDELRDLYAHFDITQIGSLYLQPLARRGKVIGILMVGFPYTRRELDQNEMRLLESLGMVSARLLAINRNALHKERMAEERAMQAVLQGKSLDAVPDSVVMTARQEMQASLEAAQNQIYELTGLVRDLQIELDYERSRLGELLSVSGGERLSITQRIEALSKERGELQKERERLSDALQQAQATLAGVTAETDEEVYENMVAVLKQEKEDLLAQKAALEKQISQIRATGAAPQTDQLQQMLATLSEEKTRLTTERDHIIKQLTVTQNQLSALGVEGGLVGFARKLAQLTEENAHYKSQLEKAVLDRETLLKERTKMEAAFSQEAARDNRIQTLEAEIVRLTQDREALEKSRDALRQERENLSEELQHLQGNRSYASEHYDSIKKELDETLELLHLATQQRQEYAAERNHFEAERDQLRAELTKALNERDSLLARIEGDRERLQELGAEGVGALTAMVNDLTRERSELESNLLRTQQEIASLKRQLATKSSQAVLASKKDNEIDTELIIALAQELRTPLSVIMGYTEVLLGESVGILGASQRQFLTRIKANVERLSFLLDDMLRVYALDVGQFDLQPQQINLVDLIDDAITASRYKFGEKDIVLDMDISEDTLSVEADADAIKQVINQLIQNAYLISPPNGAVKVVANRTPVYDKSAAENGFKGPDGVSVVYIAISDQGGGVSESDRRRVFSRLYRADNPLIQGIGEAGIGLSVVRAIIEAHGGYIWLESDYGVGSTFKLVIPVHHPQAQKVVEHKP